MTALYRQRTEFLGLPGGPGLATMYFLDVSTAVASVHEFWTHMVGVMPQPTIARVQSTGDIIEDTTGELTGAWGADPVADINIDAPTNYAAPVGGLVTWLTGTIVDGHRVKGRTYVVPMTHDLFDASGSITGSIATALQGFASAFTTEQSDSFVIWHRPRLARAADGSRPAVTARAGGHALVTGSRISTKAAVLRSRRD